MKLTSALFFLIMYIALPVSAQFLEPDTHTETEHTVSASDLITPVMLRNGQPALGKSEAFSPIREKAGLAFISSAILPGLGQAANKNWLRAGIFVAVEAASIVLMSEYHNLGKRGERNYEKWADQNWSVVQYASWLVQYHDVHGIDNPHIETLRTLTTGISPAFNPTDDWQAIDLQLLRNVERNTPYITSDYQIANNFSHVLPDYGSQQYYELIAKYYQYQAGWRDYNSFHDQLGHTGELFERRFLIESNGAYASTQFWDGALRAEQFNNNYRTGRHFMSLLIINHIFSAFDAYFSVKLKQNRLQITSTTLPDRQIQVTYRF